MSRRSNLLQEVTPFEPKAIQAQNPHTSQMDTKLAQQTAALWYQWSRTTHTWAAPNPDTAPDALVVADDTDYSFIHRDGAHDDVFQIPHMIQTDFDGIKVYGVAVVDSAIEDLYILAQAVTLVTAITTVQSPYVALGGQYHPSPPGPWNNTETAMLVPFRCTIDSPNVPADRALAITFQARWAPTSADSAEGDVTTNRTVKLFSVHLHDYIQDTTG